MTYEPFPNTPRDFDPISPNWTKENIPDCTCPACKLLGYEKQEGPISKASVDAIARHATETHALFLAYMIAGFTEDQAIDILIGLMRP
jgi:hypothetical protein